MHKGLAGDGADLVNQEEEAVNGICRFPGVNPVKRGSLKDSTLVKVTSDDLSEAIETYDELVQAVIRLASGRCARHVCPPLLLSQNRNNTCC